MVPKADRLKDIEFSKIRLLNQKVEELQAEGREMCTFTIGQPDFPTPQYIKDACTKALNDGFTGYGSYTGSLNFRQAVVDKYKRENGLEFSQIRLSLQMGLLRQLTSCLLHL